jgi:hypothetical protein
VCGDLFLGVPFSGYTGLPDVRLMCSPTSLLRPMPPAARYRPQFRTGLCTLARIVGKRLSSGSLISVVLCGFHAAFPQQRRSGLP